MASAIGNASRRAIAAGMHPNKLMLYAITKVDDAVYSNQSAQGIFLVITLCKHLAVTLQ